MPQATSRKEQRRQLHADLSRTQLLDAAEEVFGRKGFHETTLKEIAELAEFSVGSVYSFFENKDDLFLSVYLRRGEEFLPGMEEAIAGAAGAVDELHRLVDFEVGYFRDHPHFGRLYLQAAPPESPELAENFGRAMDIQAGIFLRGHADGTLRPGDPLVLARLLSGLVAAFQATDPQVITDNPGDTERMALDDLHDIVERAFT